MKKLLCFALLALCSCKFLKTATPRVERFNCQVQALQPLIGEVFDAEALVRDVYRGKADLSLVLGSLKATPAEVKAVAAALDACDPQLPTGNPS